MSRIVGRTAWLLVAVLMVAVLARARADAQCLSGPPSCCIGDCNGDFQVKASELTKIVAVILNCPGAPATGCAAVPGGCTNADRPVSGVKDGKLTAGEQTQVVINSLNFFPSGCPPTPGTGTNTPTNTVAPTNTPPPTNTPSPSPTMTSGAAVCGNGSTEGDEECDDGGVCIGGNNAGTACMSEAECPGQGICTKGTKIGTACDSDANCPDAKCIHCKPFGGDTCAANCTREQDITYDLVPGVVRVCKGGANNGKKCAAAADCPASVPPQTPAPSCANYTECIGGTNGGTPCTGGVDCPGGTCGQAIKPGTSGAHVHDGLLQLALPISGTQTLTIGKLRNNEIPGVIKANTVKLPAIGVGPLACACVRAIAAKTCGGTVFDLDGSGSTDCTEGFTAGDSVCTDAGKKPCAFVHGPGNATSGLIGCNGLDGTNLDFDQDAHFAPLPYPPAPTPPPGSGLPVITLSGSGGPGSSIVLNSSAIGTAVGPCNQAGKCLAGVCNGGTNNGNSCTSANGCPGTPAGVCVGLNKACTMSSECPKSTCAGVKTVEVSGPDLTYCSNVGVPCDNGPPCDDDPQSSRGVPQTLPQVTGTATGMITNSNESAASARVCQGNLTKGCTKDADCGADGPCLFNIGPFSYTGKTYDCSALTASPPTAEGGNVVGAFTGLNQPTTGDIVVRNTFVIGPRK